MTQEQKELLLKDLCARLPYGVLCNIGLKYPFQLQRIFVDRLDGILLDFYEDGDNYQVYLSEVKPYLRPMESMTKEEKQLARWFKSDIKTQGAIDLYMSRYAEWLDSRYLDWRTDGNGKTLIEKGLALEALEDMYNIK